MCSCDSPERVILDSAYEGHADAFLQLANRDKDNFVKSCFIAPGGLLTWTSEAQVPYNTITYEI